MSDPIRELLAFLVAREMHALCMCAKPATVFSESSHFGPVCDACRSSNERLASFTDWKDLAHAPAIRRLLAGDPA